MFPFVLAGLVAAASPGTRQDVFRAGENGYAMYRIPGLIVTGKGSLLAYCEARKTGASDWGDIMVVYRRSNDGGKTWSAAAPLGHRPPDFVKNPVALAKKVGKPDEVTLNNPVMISDPAGPVHLLYCVEYARVFYRRSDDDGRTWTPPAEVTAAVEKLRARYDWKVVATGPGHGIRLSRTGRLVVPVWLSLGTGGHAHRPSVVSTLYSDDTGKTWLAGEIAVPNAGEIVNPNETAAVELTDGRVMLNSRTESKRHRRLITVGEGATKWGEPRFQDELVEPICFGSVVRYDAGTLLFSNPTNMLRGEKEGTPGAGRDRKRLTLFVSSDDGATWPRSLVLDDGRAGYSDLAASSTGIAYCLYERGASGVKSFFPEALTLVALSRTDITAK